MEARGLRAVCVVAALSALGMYAASAVGGRRVAVINYTTGSTEGQRWCDFLAANAWDCDLLPATGPDRPLDPYGVVLDLSYEWDDPNGLLADQMRRGMGVITYSGVPYFLHIDLNQTVQNWIGANAYLNDGGDVVTVWPPPHEILDDIPVGTVLRNDTGPFDGALRDTTGHPFAEVLARFDTVGHIALLSNEWEGGRSVFLSDALSPNQPAGPDPNVRNRVILRAVEWAAPEPAALEVTIDIKPGSDPNALNLRAKGVLPVAVLGSETFDVSEVDQTSLELEGAGPREKGNSGLIGAFEDVNEDNFLDLVVQFPISELALGLDATGAELTGALLDGTAIFGADAVKLVGGAAASGRMHDMDVQPIPEPATLGLLALGALALIRRRRA